MKKVVLVAAMALGSLTAFATTPVTANNDVAVVTLQDDYKEIAVSEIPTAVQESLQADYAGATITKAYVNDEKTYKLEVTMGDQSGILFANENGEWVEQ
ncbi:hypothetical protein [Joostella sp. CR20]|uniref:hypothetical protein n=1 Tax=Joostella sp. CR20 TaxID=2804312 RepID=UPI00313E5EBA